MVRYFESQGISANGAAGIEGNTQQESGDNPLTPGGGLAQWGGGRWSEMVSWSASQGQPGASLNPKVAMAGQLMWIVYDLRTNYATLLGELNSAPDPATAATMFETTYELCSGVVGYMIVLPGSLCNDPARRQNAVTILGASGGAVPVVGVPGGTCVVSGGGGGDPIPGFTPGRDDMGVDGCAKPGMPIYAPADSVLVGIVQDWWAGQPLLLFQFTPSISGTYKNDQYWFVAEEITPVTTILGTQFSAGQEVATFAPSGTCIEIGWGSPSAISRTLAVQYGDAGAANPPRGATTVWGESFKVYFHIPWVGQSP
jgi:hypothetical protein